MTGFTRSLDLGSQIGIHPDFPDTMTDPLIMLVPASVLQPWAEQPRWRFLHRPTDGCEGVLMLLPPLNHLVAPVVWAVLRERRVLMRGRFTRLPSFEEVQRLKEPEVSDAEIVAWLDELVRWETDSSAEALGTCFGAWVHRYAANLEYRLRHSGVLPDELLTTDVRSRELCLAVAGLDRLLGCLDGESVRAIQRAEMPVSPNLYNWLTYPEGMAGWPLRWKRLACLDRWPSLTAQRAGVVNSEQANLMTSALHLNLLLDSDLGLEAMLGVVGEVLQGQEDSPAGQEASHHAV